MRLRFVAFLSLLVGTFSWKCVDIQSTELTKGVVWKTENCSKVDTDPPLLTVNSVTVDLEIANVRAVPASADPVAKLETVPQMAKHNENFIAGINGGYFWRVDVSGVWVDDVCQGKLRSEADKDVSDSNPNYGIGDGLIKVDGVVKSNNCNCHGYSRPAVLKIDGQKSNIDVLYRGETVDASVQNAIAAGPNLVSFNATTGESYVDIPKDDDNVNILEHAANTAVGLVMKDASTATKLVILTTDGSDECGPKDTSCGLMSMDLASLMKDHFNTGVAMSMDQGGSTTMWVRGVNPQRDGVVSRSHNTRPEEEDGPRNVANGLFLEILTN